MFETLCLYSTFDINFDWIQPTRAISQASFIKICFNDARYGKWDSDASSNVTRLNEFSIKNQIFLRRSIPRGSVKSAWLSSSRKSRATPRDIVSKLCCNRTSAIEISVSKNSIFYSKETMYYFWTTYKSLHCLLDTPHQWKRRLAIKSFVLLHEISGTI